MKKTGYLAFLVTLNCIVQESTAQSSCFRIGDAKYPGHVTAMEIIQLPSEKTFTLVGFSDRRILKVKDGGGEGWNIFKAKPIPDGFSSNNPSSYLIGSARFWSAPRFIKYIGGVTIIAFDNGKILKVRGIGGSGNNMFNVTENKRGFAANSDHNYLIGSAKLRSRVIALVFAQNNLILAFKNKFVLKVRGTGGGGYNMFAVRQWSPFMGSIPGYYYRIGVQRFSSFVTVMKYIGGELIIALADGKILKIHATGGVGDKMFKLIEKSDGFESVPGYYYLTGSDKFSSFANDIQYSDWNTMIGFDDGKVLKISGTGGGDKNMFEVSETKTGFAPMSEFSYYVGSAKFSSGVALIRNQNGHTIIALFDGKILKVRGTGGVGQNMFGIREMSFGFYPIFRHTYFLGDAKFRSDVSHIVYVNNKMMLAFTNKKILKVKGYGGYGSNMFRVKELKDTFKNYRC